MMTPWARDADAKRDGYGDSVPPALGDESVHAGFRGAMDSIGMRLKQLVTTAVGEAANFDDWEVVVTGHSLGGALATLFAVDIAEGVDASRSLPVRAPKSKPWFLQQKGGAAAAAARKANARPSPRKFGRLHLVTFGAPRVGDVAFATTLDTHVPVAYRVVNGQDVVARLPRGFSYSHGARTVFVSDEAGAEPLWVEGRDVGKCPLKAADTALALNSPLTAGSFLGELLDDLVDDETQQDFLDKALANPVAFFGRKAAKAVKKIKEASPDELATILGLDANYAKSELKLLSALTSGEAISHHLEPAYFLAMTKAVDKVRAATIA